MKLLSLIRRTVLGVLLPLQAENIKAIAQEAKQTLNS